MASYMWDIGFNVNSLPDPNNENYPYLRNGSVSFVGSAQNCNPNFQKGDLLGFNLFDISSPASGYQVVGGSIQFSAAVAGSGAYPFDVSTPPQLGNGTVAAINQGTLANGGLFVTIEFGPYANNTGTGGSAVFVEAGNQLPCWSIFAPQPIVNNGSFNFTFWLYAQPVGGAKLTFRADPEMIVGGTN